MKQIQEAYIVAATRTPIGRSHRGFFRNTRPDDLLVKALVFFELIPHRLFHPNVSHVDLAD